MNFLMAFNHFAYEQRKKNLIVDGRLFWRKMKLLNAFEYSNVSGRKLSKNYEQLNNQGIIELMTLLYEQLMFLQK